MIITNIIIFVCVIYFVIKIEFDIFDENGKNVKVWVKPYFSFFHWIGTKE